MKGQNHIPSIFIKRSIHFLTLLVIFSFCFLYHFFLGHEFNIIYDWIVNYIDLLMFNSALIVFLLFYYFSPVSFGELKKQLKNNSLDFKYLLGILLCLILSVFGLQLQTSFNTYNKLNLFYILGYLFFDFVAHVVLYKSSRMMSFVDSILDAFFSVFILFLFFGLQADFLYSSFFTSFFLRVFYNQAKQSFQFIIFYFLLYIFPFVLMTGFSSFQKFGSESSNQFSLVVFLISNLLTMFWFFVSERKGVRYA